MSEFERQSKTARNRGSRRKESGQPGGGQGRKEDVRGSGVYPASGPLPSGGAAVRTQGEWGRHESKVATAPITVPALRRRYSASAPTEAEHRSIGQRPAAGTQEVPRDDWVQFLDDFSRRYEGGLADLTVILPDRRAKVEARKMPLMGVSLDASGAAEGTTSVLLGTEAADHLTHTVARTTRIAFTETKQELEITAASGDTIVVRCHAPSQV